MNNRSITISIILPTYNGGDCIGRAIKSVQDQSFQDWELLVIIDGSTDTTFERVSKIAQNDSRIVIVNNEQNKGIQKTLNDGIKKSLGKYIARIDDDDVWIDRYKIEKQYSFLEKHKDHVLVGTGMVLMNQQRKDSGQYLFPASDYEIRKKILGQNCFAHSAVMYDKQVVVELGGYSEDKKLEHIEDHELWLRMGTFGKFANINDYAIAYQVSPQSISGKNKLIQFFRKLRICIQYRKQYPYFVKNFLKVVFMLVGYGLVGWIFSDSSNVRSKVTQIYKKFF
jgi:glycosyltransferase involved in cell wall biosynthesis